MPIVVACSCGQRFQANNELAGQELPCPVCGRALMVPPLSQPPDLPPPALDVRGGSPSRQLLNKSGRGGKSGKSGKSSGRRVAALSIGGVVVGAALVLVLFLALFSGEENGADAAGELAADKLAADKLAADKLPGLPGDPAFPDALASPPPYLLADAPFDVRAFFEPPRPDQNAAPLYLDALLEFSLEMSVCFTAAEQQTRRPSLGNRLKRLSSVYMRYVENEGAVGSQELDAALQELAVGFEKLDAAQLRPQCQFQTGLRLSSLLPHAHTTREVTRWNDIKTRRDVEQGRLDDALQNVLRALRLSRDLRRRAGIVQQLVSVANDGVCYEGPLKRILAAPGLTVEHCDRLLNALVAHERQGVNPILEGLRGEYVVTRIAIHSIQHRAGEFDPDFLRDELETSSLGAALAGLSAGGDGSSQEASKIDAHVTGMTDADYAVEVAKLNELYNSLATLARRPFSEHAQVIAAAESSLASNATPLTAMLAGGTPSTLSAFVRSEAQLHGAQCLVALRRWQLQHGGAAPPDLESAVKAARMTEIPRDPYGEGPLRMARQGDAVVVYSVGQDGRDDRAEADWKYGQQPGDFIFRIERTP